MKHPCQQHNKRTGRLAPTLAVKQSPSWPSETVEHVIAYFTQNIKREAVNSNFQVVGLTKLRIKPVFTNPEPAPQPSD